jgi:UDP-N-acetylglucosamine 2-epimerase (non-hydrolysing)
MNLAPDDYFVVSLHREENVDYEDNFHNLLAALNAIAQSYGKRLIVSTHPRTRKRLEGLCQIELDARIEMMKPLGFFDYVHLQSRALCVISDSGTLTEEASILGFPGVMVRQAHERPEGMDEGTVIMSGVDPERILQAIAVNMEHHRERRPAFRRVPDYDAQNVSRKVLRIILSYTDYVNRTVWHKS